MKVRKGDTVTLGMATGTVQYTGISKVLVNFGEGFTCLLDRRRVEGRK